MVEKTRDVGINVRAGERVTLRNFNSKPRSPVDKTNSPPLSLLAMVDAKIESPIYTKSPNISQVSPGVKKSPEKMKTKRISLSDVLTWDDWPEELMEGELLEEIDISLVNVTHNDDMDETENVMENNMDPVMRVSPEKEKEK